MLDMAYRLYINTMELEVEGRTDPEGGIKRYGMRGADPRPKWTRVLGTQKKTVAEKHQLNDWRALRNLLSQASVLGAIDCPSEAQMDMFNETADLMAIKVWLKSAQSV